MPGSDNNREDPNRNREDSIGGLPPSIAQSLRDILIDEGGDDLLMQSSDVGGDFRRWIEALDMQVIGACRNDERLKPLLKFNASNGGVEDRLLAHLSQHFEPSEVGLLARCLCLPLVSVRVGKIKKQGTLLSPTSIRGNLCLTLLPTSDMRILFNGDDGCVERLATLGADETKSSAVEIEDISADNSGRSFLIKTTDGSVSYFWCCEKSKLLGEELLRKMKDFLTRNVSLSKLTGISESRLNFFANELRGEYISSTSAENSTEHQSSTSYQETSNTTTTTTAAANHEENQDKDSPFLSSDPLKECSIIFGNPSSSSVKPAYVVSDNAILPSSPDNNNGEPFTPYFIEEHKKAATSIFDALSKSPPPDSGFQIFPSSGLSPHYCWCPPLASPSLQYGNSTMETLPLPPLSSLLSSACTTSPPNLLNLADLPPLDFPNLLPTSGHVPTFTPLMCEPIVHIPVIDVYSSGPGYLVSAGPSMPTALGPDFVDPLIPKVDPTVESSARETLRMLLSSSGSSQLMRSGDSMQSVLVVGSRGLYSGTLDVVGLSEISSRSGTVSKREDSVDEEKKASGSGPSDFDSGFDRVFDD